MSTFGSPRPIAPGVYMGDPVEIPEDERLPADAPLKERVIEALKTVYDPEIPVNIYELGLVYRCDVDEAGDVEVEMTLTAPGCPVAGEMPGTVETAVKKVDGVGSVKVEVVWEPSWHPGMMSDEARVALNMF